MSQSILALSLAILWSAPGGGDGGVSREAVTTYAAQCKSAGQRMELIKEFGKDFTGLDLSGVDFRGVHTVGLETNLASADFSGANLSGAQFGASVLDGANFAGANLENAEFVTASLVNANFRDSQLKGVRFQECQITGANLSNLDLSQTAFNNSNLARADLSRCILAGESANCWGVEFQGANLAGADLHRLRLSGANFRNANLHAANLEEADLAEADFSSADLTGARLAKAKVKGADFRAARGLSNVERQRLISQARRWEFQLTTSIRDFLDSLAFPIFLLFVIPLIAFAPQLGRRWLPPRPSKTLAHWQFSLANLLLVVLGICGLLGVATWSMTGAYSYTMVCALYMMVGEVAFNTPKRPQAAKLLALAMGYPILNIIIFIIVSTGPGSIFDAFFMFTAVILAPLAAVAVPVAGLLFKQAPFPWLGMSGFVVWMLGVAFANLCVIASASASV